MLLRRRGRIGYEGGRNLLRSPTDFTSALWTKGSSATATANTVTYVASNSYVQQVVPGVGPVGQALKLSLVASVATPTNMQLALADSSDGAPFHTQSIALTTTPTLFTFTQVMGAGAGGNVAVQLSGGGIIAAGTVVTFSNVRLEKA